MLQGTDGCELVGYFEFSYARSLWQLCVLCIMRSKWKFLPVSAFTDNYYLEILSVLLSVTNLNSAGKFPQNGIFHKVQSRKGLSMPMPIFKVTAEGPGAFDVFLTSS